MTQTDGYGIVFHFAESQHEASCLPSPGPEDFDEKDIRDYFHLLRRILFMLLLMVMRRKYLMKYAGAHRPNIMLAQDITRQVAKSRLSRNKIKVIKQQWNH
jgi:hypothetical protein